MVEAAPGPTPPPRKAMPQLMAISGQYPNRGDGGTTAYFTQGMVQTFAGSVPAYGAPGAQGQSISRMSPSGDLLFSILFVTYGGGAPDEVVIPNLAGRVAVGGQPLGSTSQYSLAMNWLIATGSSSQAPMPGTMAMFGGIWAPDGWLICDGSILPISQYVPLFEAIGATYGGDGRSAFRLPNLAGAAPVGAGQGPNLPPVALGQQLGGIVPGLGVNYLIATDGASPPDGGSGVFPDSGQFLGQVIAYAGAQPPPGWSPCDGSSIPIAGNQPLFQVIATSYGGDGESDFALPDLRGRMVMGSAG
jgi:microcystin-dependent protein